MVDTGETPTSRPRFWLTDARGYWRDEVLKDFVKYSVQVAGGLYIAIVLHVIPPGDVRTAIAVPLAALMYVACGFLYFAQTWLRRGEEKTPVMWLAPIGLGLALILIVRAQPSDSYWVWMTLIGMGVLWFLDRIAAGLLAAVDAKRTGGWRLGGRVIFKEIGLLLLMIAAGAAVAWILTLID